MQQQNDLSNILNELQMIQDLDASNVHGVVSNPNSDLTCIAPVSYASKKRIREDRVRSLISAPSIESSSSAAASTSGRSFSAILHQQTAEIDALVRFQNENLRLGLEQAQKRHCRVLISAIEQQVVNRMREKEMELSVAMHRNADLEEKVRQMSAENQIWFNVAKNNEAIVSSLRTSLDQLLLQTAGKVNGAVEEGYGDSEGTAFVTAADDAQSCCYEGEERADGAVKTATATESRRRCKVCCEKDVSVLLLPCRHLCLCKDCESKVETCPVCHVSRNASFQIFMA